MNVVCFGSSITAARGFAEKERWPTALQSMLERWRPGEFAVYNRGIGGNTSANLMDRFGLDVLPLLPATVILQVGGNDCCVREWLAVSRVSLPEFRRNLKELHRATTASAGTLVFTTYHIFRDERLTEYKAYALATREVAAECEAPLVDLYRMMEKRGTDLDSFLGEDGIHLSPTGNIEYAEMMFEALQSILRK